jgi:hypothetical protein
MTSQIQEKLAEDIESIKQVDETIKSEILQMENESDKENRIMMDKLNLILKEIEILKRK